MKAGGSLGSGCEARQARRFRIEQPAAKGQPPRPRLREPCRLQLVSQRSWLILDLALKAALVGLLLFAVLNPDLAQFQGKAIKGRALAYPLAALIFPAGWWLIARKRPYPFAPDILIVLPFFIDTAGNSLNLYDTIDWWDDLNHFVNWALLSAGFGLALRSLKLPSWNIAALCAGFGAATAILWELLEYVTFIRNSPEVTTAYSDTLGDLALGLSGSIIAGMLVAWGADDHWTTARRRGRIAG